MYSGSKTPTVKAVTQVKNYFEHHPKLFQQICQSIDHCAQQGKKAILEKNWPELGKIMNIQQGLMDALSVNTSELNRIIMDLRKQRDILGAKISGSGLGDCVVGLGHMMNPMPNQIPVAISERGVVCEKN